MKNEINATTFKTNFLKILVGGGILISFIFILIPFSMPIVLGGILAMAFSPLVHYLINHGFNRKGAMVIISSILFLLGAIPVFVVLIRGIKAISHMLVDKSMITLKNNIENRIYSMIDHASSLNGFSSVLSHENIDLYIGKIEIYITNLISSLLAQIPEILLLSLVTILSFYFFLLKEDQIRKWFDQYFYFSKVNGDKFIFYMKSSCKEVFFSNVITGIFQATIIATGAYFCKVGDFFIIFTCTFILSFIPIIGAGPFGAFIALMAFLDQRMGAALAMGIVATIAGVMDNVIRPYLNSRGVIEVPIIINFLAIIGGVLTMGLAGLFIGPLLASLTFGIIPIILEEYESKIK